jgi:hypothetical protein
LVKGVQNIRYSQLFFNFIHLFWWGRLGGFGVDRKEGTTGARQEEGKRWRLFWFGKCKWAERGVAAAEI